MAYFPLMIDLTNKKCVIGGGGHVAYRKAASILKFGCMVTVAAPDICRELMELKDTYGDNLELLTEKISIKHIENADMVIMSTDDGSVNKEIADYCRNNRIPVNVVDVKEESSFIFPAIYRQDDVTMAVSTGGNSPLLAAHIRDNIKESVYPDYGILAKKLGEIRDYVIENTEPYERKRVFEELVLLGKNNIDDINKDNVLVIINKGRNSYGSN